MNDRFSNISDEPELFLETDFQLRRTLDPHIASLSIRGKTNDPTEGYDLAVTAGFGSNEKVRIPIEDEVIEFRMELFKAELVLEPARCVFDATFERDRSIDAPIPSSPYGVSAAREKTTRYHVETGELLSSITGGVSGGMDQTIAEKTDVEPECWYQVTFRDDRTVQFTSRGKHPLPLNGMLLDDYAGWRVIPDKANDSGMLSRLRIREDWIRLTDPTPVSGAGKILKAIIDLLASEDEELRFRRKAFHILLSHLVAEGLQLRSNTQDATLALDAALVRPMEKRLDKALMEKDVRDIDFSGHLIAKFMAAKPGHETAVLLEAGVETSRLEDAGFTEHDFLNEFSEPELFVIFVLFSYAYQMLDDTTVDVIDGVLDSVFVEMGVRARSAGYLKPEFSMSMKRKQAFRKSFAKVPVATRDKHFRQQEAAFEESSTLSYDVDLLSFICSGIIENGRDLKKGSDIRNAVLAGLKSREPKKFFMERAESTVFKLVRSGLHVG